MEFLVEWAFGALIVVVGPLLTLLDLPGNTIMFCLLYTSDAADD